MPETPSDLQAVERRVAATLTVRRIMHAILVVSRSQYARAAVLSSEAVVYYRWLDDAIARLAGPPAEERQPRLCVLFGPERALCGSLASATIAVLDEGTAFALVGSRFLGDRALRARAVFSMAGASGAGELAAAAERIGQAIVEHASGHDVELVYPIAPNGKLQRELLLAGRRLRPDATVETYSSGETLLAAIVHQAMAGRITHALAQTLQAELAARIMVAQRARNNCDDRLGRLRDQWRVVQKEQVTRELSEVAAARLASRRL